MPSVQQRQDALLRWLNVTFSQNHEIKSLDELEDGVIFARVLHELDPSYDASEIRPQHSPQEKRRNLDTIFRSIRRSIKSGHFGNDIHAPGLSFFRKVAESPNDEGLGQILALLLGVAISCPDNQPFIEPITSLSRDTQMLLATTIQQQQDLLKAPPTGSLDADETSDLSLDHGLVYEEHLAQTNKALEAERKKLADLYNRHQHLTESHDALLAKHEEQRQEFERFQASHGDHQSDHIKAQQQKIREQEELIESQEAQIDQDRQLKERLQREVQSMSKKADQYEKFSDEIKELRHLNEDLERRANAGERYKQKLETLKGLETVNQALQEEKNVYLQRTKDYEAVMMRNSQLETTEKMLVRRIEDYENSQIIMQDEKRALLEQIRECRATIQALETTKAHDEKIIHEQREQLQVQGLLASGAQGDDAAVSTLELELLQTSDPNSAFALEISRLKAENSVLRNNMDVGSENERLRKDLESAKRSEERLQDKYNDAFEKYAISQKQIEALMNNMTGEGSEAFGNIQKQALKYKTELDAETNKRKDVEAELNDKKRELIGARTDLNAVEKDSLSALEVLKSSDELVSHSLQVELSAARKDLQDLRADLGHKNAQLMEALISKDALRKRLDESESSGARPAADESLASKDAKPDKTAQDASIEEVLKKAAEKAEKLDKLKIVFSKQKAQLEKVEQERNDLQRRLKAAESGATLAAQKASNDQMLKSLQRENAMITTAWYDLASRLQSNHVVLQRRHDLPKSWLNKQRQLVNATPRR